MAAVLKIVLICRARQLMVLSRKVKSADTEAEVASRLQSAESQTECLGLCNGMHRRWPSQQYLLHVLARLI